MFYLINLLNIHVLYYFPKTILRNLFTNPCFTGKSFRGLVIDLQIQSNPILRLSFCNMRVHVAGAIVMVVDKPRVKIQDLSILEN